MVPHFVHRINCSVLAWVETFYFRIVIKGGSRSYSTKTTSADMSTIGHGGFLLAAAIALSTSAREGLNCLASEVPQYPKRMTTHNRSLDETFQLQTQGLGAQCYLEMLHTLW